GARVGVMVVLIRGGRGRRLKKSPAPAGGRLTTGRSSNGLTPSSAAPIARRPGARRAGKSAAPHWQRNLAWTPCTTKLCSGACVNCAPEGAQFAIYLGSSGSELRSPSARDIARQRASHSSASLAQRAKDHFVGGIGVLPHHAGGVP